MLRRDFLAVSAAGMTMAASDAGFGQGGGSTNAATTGYALVNGLKVYYEAHGAGEALVLLHGGLGSTASFDGILPELTKIRRVITVDLQGHGRTEGADRPLRMEIMAGMVAGVLKNLGVDKADVLGYSMGAAAALNFAFTHPEMVKKLVVVSTVFRNDGWYPDVQEAVKHLDAGAAEQMKASPVYQNYAKIAPKPEDWPKLIGNLGTLMRTPYDWSQQVAALTCPTMLVFGDADAVRLEHAAQFFELLGGGKKDGGLDGSGMSRARLAILPGTTHYVMVDTPLLVPAVAPFLTGATATK